MVRETIPYSYTPVDDSGRESTCHDRVLSCHGRFRLFPEHFGLGRFDERVRVVLTLNPPCRSLDPFRPRFGLFGVRPGTLRSLFSCTLRSTTLVRSL